MLTPAALQERLAKLAETLPRQIAEVLTVGGLQAEAEAKKNATAILHVRSGRLRRSIHTEVTATSDGAQMALRAGGDKEVVYARIHEVGGTIVPKNGKFLAIPLAPALTGAGVSRYPSPRDVPGLSFRGNPARGVLVDKAGTPWYALVKRVTIPARPYLGPAIDAVTPKIIDRLGTIMAGLTQ